ncbi:MAG: hypothetical protein KTR31_03525 [Myxococcales bacterium]|nr:hypothetical protein [Myxococcales bacterium]
MNIQRSFVLALWAGCGGSPATFTVDGEVATMSGVIGSGTPDRVADLVAMYPEVRQITLQDVPGSRDDVANLEASRAVRAAGLATHVPADGVIASGGVDFFCAGNPRSAEAGALLGVHSWATGGGIEGGDLPRDDPQHALYLDYYEEMGIHEDFYWFTLEAAPAAGIHWMTEDEIETYGLTTD